MSPALKQRLIGAAVLIALAVIFLPMLIKGPAPASGLPNMSLDVPDAPAGDYKTVDLPLIAPPPARAGGALAGAPLSESASAAPAATRPDGGALPTVDTAQQENPLPVTVAGGGYAVHYAAFASEADAEAILRQLGASGLRGYREAFTLNDKPAQRVRLGPYANRADAEIVRVRAAQVRDDVTPRVVTLDAGARPDVARPETPAPAAPAASRPVPAQTPATPTTEQLPEEAPPARTPPAQTPPAATPAPPPATPAAAAPTSGTGFIVQLGAFSNAAEADRLRDRLRGAGITAFTDSVDTDKGRLTRVKAGPVATRGEADQLKTRVRSAVGVDGLVRSHP
ncbi:MULTISPECIES: SPOR domain-containing protein [Luteimonas]|uniref:Cell division septation protein DedD n=1 Tax=Luteimonas terrae TaxID=1530191 RepID=A0ABU1XZ50_9GAMM|nr:MULTISPECIES: SPOR domain-containing protein [Luteimonas]MDR6991411.1 cell division septation protein DedD [Luteimonas sp. 3794]MDR7194065.1 cell division septation protein DedD [Luteimonas terrae]